MALSCLFVVLLSPAALSLAVGPLEAHRDALDFYADRVGLFQTWRFFTADWRADIRLVYELEQDGRWERVPPPHVGSAWENRRNWRRFILRTILEPQVQVQIAKRVLAESGHVGKARLVVEWAALSGFGERGAWQRWVLWER